MCARFQTPAQAAAERYWKLIEPLWRYEQSWRVLPTDPVPIVLTLNGERTGRMMRWGLIPFTGEAKFPLINATVEKLESWYAWKGPWERGQRCLFSMSGFYEPHLYNSGRKEPFSVQLADRPIFGVAGLWDRSRDREGNKVLSCALITIPPNALLASVHNEKQRMPAVLREEDHEAWLSGSAAEAKSTLVPYPADLMTAWQVSRKLYAIKTPNDSSLIEPVPAPPDE
ncbi:MAG TPA: SOS response-associated peptidase [Steroidobacteraceae bacterium]|nr:SOS response-associated peptidase [Steroidobacteraceae bacterium]